MHKPPHPGKVLREYLGKEPAARSAARIGTSATTLHKILNGESRISGAMAVRLAHALNTTVGFWIDMQAAYDRSL